MTLWIIFAVMTAAAVFAVLFPLGRKPVGSTGSDRLVYQDQLHEIERDRAAGLIGEAEADSARIEISRRLLAAAEAEASAPQRSNLDRPAFGDNPRLLDPVNRKKVGQSPAWSARSRIISRAIRTTAPAGRSSLRSICGSAALPMR